MGSREQKAPEATERSCELEKKRRIAFIADGFEWPQQRACLAGIADAFHAGAGMHGAASDIVLVVTAGSEESEEYEATRLARRGFSWEIVDAETAERALYYGGLTPLRSAGDPPERRSDQPFAVPDDGIRHLCDCDAWVFATPSSPAAVLPLRPFLVMVDDTFHHASGRFSHEQLRVVADNLTAAAGVLVWSDEMLHEAVDFYGLERQRVRQLPYLPSCQALSHQARLMSETLRGEPPAVQGGVWFVADASAVSVIAEHTASIAHGHAEPPEIDEQTMLAYGEALADML